MVKNIAEANSCKINVERAKSHRFESCKSWQDLFQISILPHIANAVFMIMLQITATIIFMYDKSESLWSLLFLEIKDVFVDERIIDVRT